MAQAFSNTLSRPIKVPVTTRTKWVDAYQKLGFSEAAARSYARMTAVTLDGAAMPDDPLRGSVTLQQYVTDLVNNAHSGLSDS